MTLVFEGDGLQPVHKCCRINGALAVIGNPIEPVIKLSGNPKTVATMGEHIDLDVSKILQGEMTIDQAGEALIDMVVRTAYGRLTAAEALGHREFSLTKLYRSA